jgi:putative SOS response-associated peptidase YedK
MLLLYLENVVYLFPRAKIGGNKKGSIMCGRFVISIEADELQQELDLGPMPADWLPRFNVAPSQPVAVVVNAARRAPEWMRWGLIPSWAKDANIGAKLINARSETVGEKPSFRSAFARRRCLILATGFYEWQRQPSKRAAPLPYYFYLVDQQAFAFAGLWETWKSPEGKDVRSCTILTCPANSVVLPVHERMPVILNRQVCWHWLEERATPDLYPMLVSYPAEKMAAYPVSRIVNDPAHDSSECIVPFIEPSQGSIL